MTCVVSIKATRSLASSAEERHSVIGCPCFGRQKAENHEVWRISAGIQPLKTLRIEGSRGYQRSVDGEPAIENQVNLSNRNSCQ